MRIIRGTNNTFLTCFSGLENHFCCSPIKAKALLATQKQDRSGGQCGVA